MAQSIYRCSARRQEADPRTLWVERGYELSGAYLRRGFCLVAMALFAPLALLTEAEAQTAYYLNDLSTNGNFYTTAVGSDTNSGLSASTPMRTLTNLLATHTLAPGDTVYIDTGTYGGHRIDISVSGTAADPITFQGAPEEGATIFDRSNGAADMFYISNGNHLRFRHMTVTGARYGFSGPGSFTSVTGNNGLLESMIIRDNLWGMRVTGTNWILRNSLFTEQARLL